jgi:capsular polysaccharide biosynthesis protein
MEARRALKIVLRWWWVVDLMVVLVGAIHFATAKPAPTSYVATMKFSVGVSPEPKNGTYYTYDRYYTWLTSEYLVDDLAEVVRSGIFASEVTQRLKESGTGLSVPPGAIQASTQTGRLHRILTVTISWGDRDQLKQIAEAAAATLQDENARFLPALGATNARAILINPPSIGVRGPGLRQKLELPVRLTLAFIAGLVLVLLWEYLDDSVRDASDLKELGIPVLGIIPRK